MDDDITSHVAMDLFPGSSKRVYAFNILKTNKQCSSTLMTTHKGQLEKFLVVVTKAGF